MRKLLLLLTLALLLAQGVSHAAPAPDRNDDQLYITGVVKDRITGRELLEAKVLLYDAQGEVTDTLDCNFKSYIGGEVSEHARFYIPVDRLAGTVTFDIICDGYHPYTIVKDISGIHRKENTVSLPPIMLERAPRKLGEVTVTASKIKFYNKGDTIVYNADAFQLAEGSMLDALVAQLPGVQLKEGGAIYVNGEYVESLLLNGRDFFKGKNSVMLENIGAYTVKNIEVYRGQTADEKWADDPTVAKHLTMDVKLKKEYTHGYMANLQAGYGTDGRYMGRLFTSLFTPTLSVQLVGNINNVSDTRIPGKDDSWTPQSMPSGTLRRKMAGINYFYSSKDDKKTVEGNAFYNESRPDSRTSTYRTNFLAGGDTYEYRFGANRSRSLSFETRHTGRYFAPKYKLFGMAVARWNRSNSMSDHASASFREEQDSMSRAAIEAIYSDGTPQRLDAVINRSISRSDGVRTSAEFQGFFNAAYKTPWPGQILSNEVGVKYRTDRDHSFDDYLINYGSDPTPAARRRNFTDVSPDHTLSVTDNLTYTLQLGRRAFMNLNYEFCHEDTRRNSSLYALDRLADMGVYGVLPAGWTEAFDPSNSYTSRTLENRNSLASRFSYDLEGDTWGFYVLLAPEIVLTHRRLDYGSDMKDYHVSRNWVMATLNSANNRVSFAWGADSDRKGSLRGSARNELVYQLGVATRLPNLLHMVDVVNDANPLYIDKGNSDLKPAYVTTHQLSWNWTPKKLYTQNTLSLSYNTTAHNLVRGYSYDTSTGVRVNRTYNVSGDYSIDADNFYRYQFGSKEQFTLSLGTSASTARSVDMIGVDAELPSRSSVRNRSLRQSVDFNWEIGSQAIALRAAVNDRHTTSTRPDFNAINAQHYVYGLNGVFQLPGDFTISTGFTVYTRHGYGVKELDTTSKVWDIRIVRPFSQGKWVAMIDAFDLLHELSNVSYAVNAQGRSVVYTNTIPRYVMFTVQYRFNHNPKKLNDTPLLGY